LAIYVSKGLYKPIDKLLLQSGFNKDDKEIEKDEFIYLEQMYKNSSDQLEKYSNEKITNDKIMKLYFLRNLILESFAVTGEEIKLYKTEYKILLDFDKPFIVCILKIDRYKQFLEKYNINEKNLIKTELINVIGDVLSSLFTYEIVDMKDDEIVVIYNIGSDAPNRNTEFNELLVVLQNIVEDKFSTSFSTAISTVITDIRDLTKAYEAVLSNSKYRFVYGDKCIISIDMIENKRVSKHIDLHFEKIKNFTEQIRNSNIEVVENKFNVLLNELKTLEYNDMMLSLVYLTNSVKNLVYELNMTNKEPINISSILSSSEVFEIETVDEFNGKFIELLKEIVNREVAMGNKRYMMTVETIKEIIETNYQDVNLSTVGIAKMIRISPSTISRIFKVHTSVSILEYINTTRLNKAVEWMENSKLSIGEIMFKVGIENESYFYKIFKKKYGATPREFISQKSINGLKG
jgi:AraC-like DNA-binding protein